MAIYTATPFAIQWLSNNGFNTWAIILGIGQFVGFILMGVAVIEFNQIIHERIQDKIDADEVFDE